MAMSYAQALKEAKNRIVEQTEKLQANAVTLKKQQQEISQRKAHAAELKKELAAELERNTTLEVELTRVTGAKEAAEATVGRQRVQLDQMEARLAEHQDTIEQQTRRIDELTAEVDSLRAELEAAQAKLPTEEDIAALEDISKLLGDQGEQREDKETAAQPALAIVQDGGEDSDPNADTDVPAAAQPARSSNRRSVFCFTRAAA